MQYIRDKRGRFVPIVTMRTIYIIIGIIGLIWVTGIVLPAIEPKPQTLPKPIATSTPPSYPFRGTDRVVTAYTSHAWQTDSTPCIAADGTDICKRYEKGERLCAANFVPLGTILHVGDYGNCVVADRMNRKHPNRVDIYLGYDLQGAIAWGKKTMRVYSIE